MRRDVCRVLWQDEAEAAVQPLVVAMQSAHLQLQRGPPQQQPSQPAVPPPLQPRELEGPLRVMSGCLASLAVRDPCSQVRPRFSFISPPFLPAPGAPPRWAPQGGTSIEADETAESG